MNATLDTLIQSINCLRTQKVKKLAELENIERSIIERTNAVRALNRRTLEPTEV